MSKLDDVQRDDLAFLKKNAEKVLYQNVEHNGSDSEDDWCTSVAIELSELPEDEIVAVYELVGFKRVNVARTLKSVE